MQFHFFCLHASDDLISRKKKNAFSFCEFPDALSYAEKSLWAFHTVLIFEEELDSKCSSKDAWGCCYHRNIFKTLSVTWGNDGGLISKNNCHVRSKNEKFMWYVY